MSNTSFSTCWAEPFVGMWLWKFPADMRSPSGCIYDLLGVALRRPDLFGGRWCTLLGRGRSRCSAQQTGMRTD
eukprot:6401791-Lingulodinium_polyedra.AAC.1